MREKRTLMTVTFLTTFLLVTASAYGQDVHYNYDRSANFATYRTYQWVDIIPGGGVPDRLIDSAIKQAADEQLAQKGLTKVSENADLYIGYQVVVNLEKSVDLWSTGTGPGGWDGWGDRSVRGQTSTVPVGILLLDLYDVGKKELVWRGDAMKTIDLKTDPNKNYKNLQKVMAKLFKNYPPKPGK